MTRLVPLLMALLMAPLLSGCARDRPPAGVLGDPEAGKLALSQYACQACHIIPGVTGSRVYVGRPLDDLRQRRFIAGTLPLDQAGLVRWIRDPQSIDPHTAMPNMGVSERDARDMSAYLLSQ